MSDHGIAPVPAPVPAPIPAPVAAPGSPPIPAPAPVPAHQPPYYAVVFTSLRTEGDNGYGETADRMGELVKGIPGFLGEDSARVPGGLGITVAYFRDLAGIEAWRAHAEHRVAKEYGREHWYERYSLHIAKVEYSRGFERGAEAEADTAAGAATGARIEAVAETGAQV
ncbi:antibiotic biosynthesis monooxygenase [Streptomyces sp. NBC_00252]|uniref:antibiotic biosynthesis monooxygenase family protein n=1 Tax=Streptomyces sp. NBC_00252 TaxID=2975691 RepID=UPI002E2CB514|nr:antibiotic biosynthesis monooxygenase [Streptomyces sp. NBC_00252]